VQKLLHKRSAVKSLVQKNLHFMAADAPKPNTAITPTWGLALALLHSVAHGNFFPLPRISLGVGQMASEGSSAGKLPKPGNWKRRTS
jgi:hypothetical protein